MVTGGNIKVPRWARRFMGGSSLDGYERVRRAVSDAEGTTSGEIVPMLVRSSQWASPGATWAVLSVSLGVAFLITLLFLTLPRDFHPATFTFVGMIEWSLVILLWPAALAVSGAGWLHRWIFSRETLRQRVERRALWEFHAAGLHETRDATGILLFVSARERQAVVLADKSIADRLPPETWDGVLRILLDGLARGDAPAGFVAAIARCGAILAEHFPPRADDRNELSDRFVVKP